MANDELMLELNDHMLMAEERYGDYASTHEALGVACEEWDELRAAVHANKLESVREESVST